MDICDSGPLANANGVDAQSAVIAIINFECVSMNWFLYPIKWCTRQKPLSAHVHLRIINMHSSRVKAT